MNARRVTRSGRPVYATPNRRGSKPTRQWRPPSRDHLRYGLFGAGVLGIILIIAIGFSINSLQVQSLNGRRSAEISKLVQSSLDRHITWRNLLLISPGKLRNEVMGEDYQIRDLVIERKWPHTLVVQATEKQPALTWKTTDQTYLLDLDGSIIGPAGEAGSKLPAVVDSTNLPVKIGDHVVPASFVSFCSQLVEGLPKRGVAIIGLRVPDTTSEVYVATNKGYFIKFDTTRPVEGELVDLASVMAELAKEKRTPVEYIDLRIAHKAYYK